MTETGDGAEDSGSRPTSFKVGRVINEFGLDDLEQELQERWTGERGERTSLRDLADIFNKKLLREVMEENGLTPLQSEIERKYDALTGESGAGMKTDVESELERNGVDVDSLESNFVSHQSIHTYLTEYLDAKLTKPNGQEKTEKALNTIQRLQSRTLAVTEGTISRLRKTDEIATGELEVFVNISVLCSDCGKKYDVGDLLSKRECECADHEVTTNDM